MKSIKTARIALVGALAGVVLLLVIGEITFQNLTQSGWETYFPKDSIDALAVDPQGQLWVQHGRSSGFSIFDGTNWKELEFPASSPVDFKFINTIAFDHLGRVWIGTNYGIAVLDGDVWTSYTPDDSGLKHRVVETILEDQQQQILVWTLEGAQVFNGKIFSDYDQPAMPGGSVVDTAQDSLGRQWLAFRGENFSSCYSTQTGSSGTFMSVVSMYDGKVWTNYDLKALTDPYTIQAIAVDKQDQIWVATTGGLHVFNGSTWETVLGETAPSHKELCIEDLAVDPQGKIWIVSEGGMLGIHEGDQWLRLDDHNLNIPEGSKFLKIDPSGHAWIASESYDHVGLWSISTSKENDSVLPSGLLSLRYVLTLLLGGSFWILLGLTSIAVTRRHATPAPTAPGEILKDLKRNTWIYIVFGSVVGLLVALVGGFLHDVILLILTGGLWTQVEYTSFLAYSWYAGPITGALVGVFISFMARFRDAPISDRRVVIVIGTMVGALCGILQVAANSYPGMAEPFYNPYNAWIYVLAVSPLQASLGMFLGYLSSFIVHGKVPLTSPAEGNAELTTNPLLMEPIKRRFFSLPRTRLGWVSAVFGIINIVSIAVSFTASDLNLLSCAFAPCGLVSGAVSLIALIKAHERSWLVWLSLLSGLISILFFLLLAMFLSGHP